MAQVVPVELPSRSICLQGSSLEWSSFCVWPDGFATPAVLLGSPVGLDAQLLSFAD